VVLGVLRSQSTLRDDKTMLTSASRAVEDALSVLSPATSPRARIEAQSQRCQLDIVLGRPGPDPARFRSAVAACDAALTRLEPGADPPLWQNLSAGRSLASALVASTEADLPKFESALSAYERSLVEISQSDDHRAWKQAVHNYRALFSLLEDFGRPEYLLKRVNAVFDKVLAVADDQKAALRSARAQVSKGETLFDLGMERRRRFKIDEARKLWVDARKAFEAASRTFTRERHPERWAALEVHIGDTLAWDGEASEAFRPNQAITRYRKALTVQTSASLPAAHAATQFRLGLAYLFWADNNRNTERLERAIEAFRASLETQQSLGERPAWTQTHDYLTESLGLLASRKWRPPCAALEFKLEAARSLPQDAPGAKKLAELLATSKKHAGRNGVTPKACPNLSASFWSDQVAAPSARAKGVERRIRPLESRPRLE
jgi:hypothetical protein